jgi:hypothetical protein
MFARPWLDFIWIKYRGVTSSGGPHVRHEVYGFLLSTDHKYLTVFAWFPLFRLISRTLKTSTILEDKDVLGGT